MSDPQTAAGAQQFFIRIRGRVLGPFSLEKLRALRSRGQFSRAHEYSSDRQNWQPASALEGLLDSASVSRPAIEAEAARAASASPGMPALPQVAAPAGSSLPGAVWYYNVAGELYGPVSVFDLRGMVAAGNLRADDYVWKEGMPNWLPIAQLPELKPPPAGSSGSAQSADLVNPRAFGTGARRTSGLAMASFVLGLLGVVTPVAGILFNLLAIALGAVALKSIWTARGAIGGRGLAISGLALGLIGLALWTAVVLYLLGVLAPAGLPEIWQN